MDEQAKAVIAKQCGPEVVAKQFGTAPTPEPILVPWFFVEHKGLPESGLVVCAIDTKAAIAEYSTRSGLLFTAHDLPIATRLASLPVARDFVRHRNGQRTAVYTRSELHKLGLKPEDLDSAGF